MAKLRGACAYPIIGSYTRTNQIEPCHISPVSGCLHSHLWRGAACLVPVCLRIPSPWPLESACPSHVIVRYFALARRGSSNRREGGIGPQAVVFAFDGQGIGPWFWNV